METHMPYRVTMPLRGVYASEEFHGFITIPKNALLRVVGPNGDEFLRIRWKDTCLFVFAQDLQEKAALLAPDRGIGVDLGARFRA